MKNSNRPTKEQAMEAVKTLISWTGDNPEREGLLDTPKRVVEAYEEFFSGYNQDPKKILSRTFEEVADYDDMVLLKNMRFESHCEHHMVPFIGTAHIAYIPNKNVVGISKIARLLDIFSKRLQTQETMTSQIAKSLEESLSPLGIAVLIEGEHQCMTTRGVHKAGTTTVTTRMTGLFRENKDLESKFFEMIKI